MLTIRATYSLEESYSVILVCSNTLLVQVYLYAFGKPCTDHTIARVEHPVRSSSNTTYCTKADKSKNHDITGTSIN